jgi:hypothetical protein
LRYPAGAEHCLFLNAYRATRAVGSPFRTPSPRLNVESSIETRDRASLGATHVDMTQSGIYRSKFKERR